MIEPSRLAAVLGRLDLTAEGPDALVLVACQPAAALWANPAALALLAATDLETIGRKLFGEGPAGFARRLARLPSSSFRLERVSIDGRPRPTVIACHPVPDEDPRLAVLHVRDGAAAVPRGPAPTFRAPVPDAAGRPVTRILWETDAAGILTRIDERGRLLGADAPRPGDDLPARLRPVAPAMADRIAAAARQGGSVGRDRLEWAVSGTDVVLALEAGCAPQRGGAPGLRGFFAVHGAAGLPGSAPPDTVAAPGGSAGEDVGAEPVTSTPAAVEAPDAARLIGPEPSTSPPPRGFGNVVHFPAMRLGPVPATFGAALQPTARPAAPTEAIELPEPAWAEAPDAALGMDALSDSERDAFEHIRKILSHRPLATSGTGKEPAVPSGRPPVPGDPQGAVEAGRGTEAGRAPGPATMPVGPDAGSAPDGQGDAVPVTPRLPPAAAPPPSDAEPARPDAGPAWTAAMLDLVTDGHLRLDRAGTVLAASPAAGGLLGVAAGDLAGRPFASLLAEGQAPGWRALVAAATAPDATPPGPVSLTLRTAAGQPVATLVRLAASGGALLCVLAHDRPTLVAANDTAEAARREAERTSALKSEFLAKVSHEIRTPLNAILGFTEVIRDERLGPVGNARYLEYLRDIHASGTHVMSLVNDLLDLSRIEAGRMDLNLVAVDANAIVQACVNALQTLAHGARVIVRLSLTPRLPPALADERSFRQIALNLLSNAIKFNEPGGQVIVSTALIGAEAVAIRVRDTGIGMSEDEIAAAMEPFRQLSTVNRTGSGLGLPLTKALVEANCASMSIKSTRREGTLVEVVFPLVEAGPVSLPAQ